MKRLPLISLMLLAGCAAGGNFKPTTTKGAECKNSCAQNMVLCQGSSYTCDRASASCMASCAEIDALEASK